MRWIFILAIMFSAAKVEAQETDTIKVMSYNLLKFPAVSPNRIDTLKEILAYLKPDIFMACELTSGGGASDILFDALNEDGESDYDMADYIPGPDTENALYFNSAKLGLLDQNVIPTDLRDINEYVLYYKSLDIETTTDTTFFYVYVCHLKASSGNEAQRNNEAIALKTYINTRGYTENIIIGGDFNFYGSDTEPAWNTILTGGGVTLKDPLLTPGHWHGDNGFAWLHTQSTRVESLDGGAYGGMDDRFDFIFIGEDLKTFANDALYINGSYRAVGQDGMHYNKSILEAPTNTSEPTSIISNLYYMSDHLPIYMELEVVREAAGLNNLSPYDFEAYFDAQTQQIRFKTLPENPEGLVLSIYDMKGKQLQYFTDWVPGQGISTQALEKGAYIFKVEGTGYALKFVRN